MKVELTNLPIMISSNQYQSDISRFLGIIYIIINMNKQVLKSIICIIQAGNYNHNNVWLQKIYNIIIEYQENG